MIGTMPERDFTHIHVSGLWDAPRARWIALLKSAMRIADVITVTEFTQDPTHGWLPDGWSKVHFSGAGRNECAIFWKQSTFRTTRESPWIIPISKTPYALGSGKIRPRVHLLGLELEHIATGKTANFEVFHTPSAIEGHGGLVAGVRRTRAMLECLSAVNIHRKTELKGEATVLSADWNLNLKLPWVQAFFRSRLRGFRSAWRRPLPSQGSHGKRLIDGPRFTNKLKLSRSSRLAGIFRPFDHRMVITEFAFR